MQCSPKQIGEYLDAAGVVPLCLIADACGVFAVKQGRAFARECADEQVFWVSKDNAVAIGRAYRAEEPTSSLKSAQAALFRAASRYGIVPSANASVISRASVMTLRLDAEIKRLRNAGALQAFNVAYQKRRENRTASGHGFMTYAAALSRLRKLLIARLASGNWNGSGMQMSVTALFEEIFRDVTGPPSKPSAG